MTTISVATPSAIPRKEKGDDRNKARLAPRAQIAERDHPLEGANGLVPFEVPS
jgi:hypothetical protein